MGSGLRLVREGNPLHYKTNEWLERIRILDIVLHADCTNSIPGAKNVRIHVGSMDVIADVSRRLVEFWVRYSKV